MKKNQKKYLIELTHTQLVELLEWHNSRVDKYRKMGVKKDFLKFHKDCDLATYIRETNDLIRLKEAIDGEYGPQTSSQERI